MSTINNDDYFDEDGNLKATSWTLKEQRKREQEERRREKQEKEKRLKEINRRMAIDERSSKIAKQREEDKKKRDLKDNWLLMPNWIKRMPKTSLKEPPTEGVKEKALYALTKKVTLTPEEERKRKAQLKRLKIAIDDYEGIHREFPEGTRLAPITIISLGNNAGGTIVSRSLSAVIAQSRNDLGNVVTMDFSSPDSELHNLYGSFGKENVNRKTTMRHIVKQLNVLRSDGYSFTDVYPIGGEHEYYLDNFAEKERRVDIGIKEVAGLYKFMRNTEGICIFDCDLSNIEALVTSVIVSSSVIFVLPLTKNAENNFQQVLHELKTNVSAQDYEKIIKNSMVVFSASNPKMMEKNNLSNIKKFLHKITTNNNLELEPIIIPFDKAVKSVPFNVNKMKFSTAHIFRKIASQSIESIIQKSLNEGQGK